MKRCIHPLICPVCEADLAQAGNTLKCPQSHSFDIAREGYVNLLLTNQKRPRILGDTKDMLRARRNFLNRGFYSPLSDAINEQVYNHLVDDPRTGDASSPTCIAEVGCGEGYYIGRLRSYLDSRLGSGNMCYFGMDISKEAARLAAKRYKEIRFFVASINERILFSSHSIQVLLNIFAPRNSVEFDRVVAGDGTLLVVIPSPNHLANLRSDLGLLGIEPHKQQHVIKQFAGTFELAEKQPIEVEMHLNGKELCDLIQMTPNYWHISKETWDDMEAIKSESIQAKASFTILTFHKRYFGSKKLDAD